MGTMLAAVPLLLLAQAIQPRQIDSLRWLRAERAAVTIYYTKPDSAIIGDLESMIAAGRERAVAYFGAPYPARFEVRVFPGRVARGSAGDKAPALDRFFGGPRTRSPRIAGEMI